MTVFPKLTIKERNNGDKITQICNYLKDNYIIKVNEFDTSKTLILARNKTYNFPITPKTIYIDMITEGVQCSKTLLNEILSEPNYIESFNPLKDFFEGLDKKFKGASQIDLIGKYIKAREFGDKPEGHYQKRFELIFKKWLVNCVACVKGLHFNEITFGFIEPSGGVGKTYFFEKFLLPDPIIEFYIKSDKDKKIFNMAEAFIKNFLINFDEFIGLESKNAEDFKSYTSSSSISYKPFREPYARKFQRIANTVFTHNSNQELGGFFTPNMSLRRFACVEILTIDHEYSKKINAEMLWAEACLLLNSGFDYKFKMEDFDEFKEYNRRYVIESPIANLLSLFYSPAEKGQGIFKTAEEILQDLNNARKIPASIRDSINNRKIGTELHKLNFITEKKRHKLKNNLPVDGYYVNQLY